MSKLYFWDLDSTLIPAEVRAFEQNVITLARAENNALIPPFALDSREFSQLYVKHFKKYLKEQGYHDNSLLINEEAILPLLQSILDNGGDIILSSAGMSSKDKADLYTNTPVFHIFNAYLNGFSADKIDSIPSSNPTNLMKQPKNKEESEALNASHSALGRAFTIDKYKNDQQYQADKSAYEKHYPGEAFVSRYLLQEKDNDPNSLVCTVEIEIEKFQDYYREQGREIGKNYADRGQKFLGIVKYLFQQGIKVNFSDSMEQYGIKVSYPEGWEATKTINAADLVLIDDKPVFMQFFEIVGGIAIQADTGDVIKSDASERFNEAERRYDNQYGKYADKAVKDAPETAEAKVARKEVEVLKTEYCNIKVLSETEIADVKRVKTNTFIGPLQEVVKADHKIGEFPKIDKSWDRPVKPQPSISKGEKVALALSITASAVGGAAVGLGLGGLFFAFIKTTTLAMGAGIIAGSAAGPIGSIVFGIIGGAAGASTAAASAYYAHRLFRSPPAPESPAPTSDVVPDANPKSYRP